MISVKPAADFHNTQTPIFTSSTVLSPIFTYISVQTGDLNVFVAFSFITLYSRFADVFTIVVHFLNSGAPSSFYLSISLIISII